MKIGGGGAGGTELRVRGISLLVPFLDGGGGGGSGTLDTVPEAGF